MDIMQVSGLESTLNENSAVYLKETEGKGVGLFANNDFKRGEPILVIAGPIVNEFSYYTIPIKTNLFIDPVPVKNLGMYLNHSCDPNLGIKNNTIVTAFKDIKKDDELVIDYAMIVDFYEADEEDIVCQCGKEKCRGLLGSWKRLPEELKEEYRGFTSDYIMDFDKELKQKE